MFTAAREPDGTIKLAGKLHDAYSTQASDIFANITHSCTVDFSELIYISSSGLSLLLLTQKRLEETGQGLTLTGMTDHVRELFAVTRFDAIFDIR